MSEYILPKINSRSDILFSATSHDRCVVNGLSSQQALLRHRVLRSLGIRHMGDGRISKDILYDELALGRRTTGRPHLRYNEVCKGDTKTVETDTVSWESLAANLPMWRSALNQHHNKAIERVDHSSRKSGTQEGAEQFNKPFSTWVPKR